ncbi:mannan-binding lectin serine protease 1-like [Neosynchiropus ocellatus]
MRTLGSWLLLCWLVEVLRPDAQGLDAQRLDAQRPDPQRLDPLRPDARRPDPQRPDAQRPDLLRPDAQRPDAQRPDPQRPDLQRPDAQRLDPLRPDPLRLDSLRPDPQRPNPQTPDGPLLSPVFGSLKSPNFPGSYPPDSALTWNISVPDGFRVKLYFSHFDLEPSYLCEYDYVKVEAEGELLGLFCGREDTDTESVPDTRVITSPRTSLSVSFRSDFSDEERFSGFLAHYSAADVDECDGASDEDLLCDHFCHNYIGGFYCSCRHGYVLHSDDRTCRVECASLLRERSGVLSSVDFPAPYPKSSECRHVIEVEAGLKLRLHFDELFDVEDHPDVRCPYDHVKIEVEGGVLGPFCGTRSPGTVHVDGNVAVIVFHSDDSGENRGWRLTYSAEGSRCLAPRRPANGLITPDQSEYSYRDQVLVACSPGFRLLKGDGEAVDQLQMECRADGRWSEGESVSEPPVCSPACGRPTRPLPRQAKRIVGGRAAELGWFPWQVLLSVEDLSRVPEDRWFGSGALLSRSWILTAAHVLRSQRRDASVVAVVPEHVKVYLGLLDFQDQTRRSSVAVERIVLHPNFRPQNYNHDVALLKLREPVDPSDAVHPVCLPPPARSQDPPAAPLPNALGVVAGWGLSQSLSDPPPLDSGARIRLQYVKLPVVPQEECRASYASRSVSYNITDDMFCAGFLEGGRDTCLGDSGGAFVMEEGAARRWAVFGLVSWAGPEECGSQRVYGVYTRVARYLDWIWNQTGGAL